MEHFTPPTRVSARPTQPTETTNILLDLDAVPVPFDFSRSRHDLASRGNGETEGQIKETSLWWYHPTFEARAKADIRRSLSTLLPSDPSQDPSPEDIMGGRRAEVRPRRSRVQIWDLPEDPFGSAPLDRGLGSSKVRFSLDTCKYTYNVNYNISVFSDRQLPRNKMMPIVCTPRTVLIQK
jgi:hypothetical protein